MEAEAEVLKIELPKNKNMNISLKKTLFISLAIVGSLYALGLNFASAQFLDPNAIEAINNNVGVVQGSAGYDPNLKLGAAVAFMIRGFLGLLGIIFIILIIVAGYNWMTAGGDEEKIRKATSTIRSAIIGLVIIVAAYSITYFVFSNLPGGSV